MPKEGRASFEPVLWKDIREEAHQVNPELAKIIDELNPGAEYLLFKGRYPYGSEIVKNGRFQLPDDTGRITTLTDKHISPSIQKALAYNIGSNPVSLVLKNSMELFMLLETHTIPYGLIPEGSVMSTWRVLNPGGSQQPAFLWQITAGARSTFMLPKITQMAGYRRLRKELHVPIEKPDSLLNHWYVFKELANQKEYGDLWFAEILYFSEKWFEKLEDPTWKDFHYYLLKTAWRGSDFRRNQFVWNLVFSLIQRKKKIKPDPYIADTVKHLLFIATGGIPGFTPALDEKGIPVKKLQKIFLEVYGLKDYLPAIMQPTFYLPNHPQNPVYYSLQYPNLFEFSPRKRENPSALSELFEVRSLLNKYVIEILSGELNIGNTPFYEAAERIRFDYFHSDKKLYDGMRNSADIFKEDPRFNKILCPCVNKELPFNSTFVRGCVRISTKEK